ncbi:MAG: RNA polymerase sigma factor [Pseudonocardia sp.]
MPSDEVLLAAVGRGEDACLRVLYERHAAAMLRLIRRLTSDRGVAEEILQEAWLAVWRSAGSYRGEASARAWLFGVTRRQAHNRLRAPRPQLVDLDRAAEELADGAPGVEDVVLAGLRAEELAVAVRGLPAHLREVLVLVLVEELPYSEVAAVLDIPVGTVKSRMSHARRRLAGTFASTPDGGGRS